MKLNNFVKIIIFLCSVNTVAASLKNTVTPYQGVLLKCFGKNVDVTQIKSNEALYKTINEKYPLVSSQLIFKEVTYTQKNVQKKLRFENGTVQVFAIKGDDDETQLLTTEKFSDIKQDYKTRHKIRSPEEMLNQLLFQAYISTQYEKVKEIHANQVVLNVSRSDRKIKTLDVEFLTEKKTLSCSRPENSDICSCRN